MFQTSFLRRRFSAPLAWLGLILPFLPASPLQADPALDRVIQDQSIQVGMYLGFEGLSFKNEGKLSGLEYELVGLLAEKLSSILKTPIKPSIVNQEWSQIVKGLRDQNYDLIFSALIPSRLYDSYRITYSASYLDTGPTICTSETRGKPAEAISADPSSLEGKAIVVINDPAVRRVLRRAGVYVPSDSDVADVERGFPLAATQEEMKKSGNTAKPIPLRSVIQLDDMTEIYQLIADKRVDAGVIDLGIIWWVSTQSPRWKDKIYAFPKPIGPYIYSAATREEDVDLARTIQEGIALVKQDPRYREIISKWHGPAAIEWHLRPDDFMN